jgi:hypothetical protein
LLLSPPASRGSVEKSACVSQLVTVLVTSCSIIPCLLSPLVSFVLSLVGGDAPLHSVSACCSGCRSMQSDGCFSQDRPRRQELKTDRRRLYYSGLLVQMLVLTQGWISCAAISLAGLLSCASSWIVSRLVLGIYSVACIIVLLSLLGPLVRCA